MIFDSKGITTNKLSIQDILYGFRFYTPLTVKALVKDEEESLLLQAMFRNMGDVIFLRIELANQFSE